MNKLLNRWKVILKFAWPLIVANSFWNLQLTIDRIFLGAHSTESLGAAMAVMGVFWVPMALLQQTASYVTAFIAQYHGANEDFKIGSCIWQAFYVSVIGGLLFLGLNFASPYFFNFVGHTELVQNLEVSYFNSLAYSALPTALAAAISGFFTGLGRTKTVVLINFAGLFFNVIFDYLLIFGNLGFPEMGIEGAGYATAIAGYCSAFYGIYLIYNNRHEELYRLKSEWKLNFKLIKQFLKYGLPSGFQWAFEGLAFTVFLIIMGRAPNGEAALASSSIAVTVMMLSVLPTMGIAQSVLTLVGQKLGEKKPNEAVAITWDGVGISFIYIATIATTFFLMPDFYLSWFKNEQNLVLWNQVNLLTPELLKIVGIFIIFDCFYINISFALKGAGDTAFVSYIALIIPWPLMVLPAFLLMETPDAIVNSWRFIIVYMCVLTVILITRFQKGKWKGINIRG